MRQRGSISARLSRKAGPAIGLDLSAGMLRSLEDLRQSGFTTESGAALLSREFSSVTLRTHDVPLSIPSVQPVIAYVASIREPILAQGSFRTTSNVGVFSCP